MRSFVISFDFKQPCDSCSVPQRAARAARRGTSTACGANGTRTDQWPPPPAPARSPRGRMPGGFAMKTTAQSLGKVSRQTTFQSRGPFTMLTISIFADYANFLRDDSDATAATPASPANNLACGGDQSKYCGLVKSFDMCHVPKYKRQCCASCSSSFTSR